MIKKHKLIKGCYYIGTCRNTNIAMWDGEKFIFINYFFTKPYLESIEYYGDVKNQNFDGFIPIKCIEVEFNDIKKARLEQDYKNGARKIYLNYSQNDMGGEIWKPIPDYEGLYYASNHGRIKKHDGNHIMKQNFSRDYLVVGLTGYNHKRKTLRVHRLIALTFNSSESTLEQNVVDHDNGIKTDNRNTNLKWVTHKQNSQNNFTSGNYHIKLKPETVVEIKQLLKSGEISQIEISKKFNVSRSTISEINTGKKWVNV